MAAWKGRFKHEKRSESIIFQRIVYHYFCLSVSLSLSLSSALYPSFLYRPVYMLDVASTISPFHHSFLFYTPPLSVQLSLLSCVRPFFISSPFPFLSFSFFNQKVLLTNKQTPPPPPTRATTTTITMRTLTIVLVLIPPKYYRDTSVKIHQFSRILAQFT